MEYLIKIDYSRLNDKYTHEFIERFNGKKFDKYIVSQNEDVAIVKVQIFDYLIFDQEVNKKLIKNLRLSLLLRDEKKKSNNIKVLYENVKINTDEYNELVRQLRF